jgi:hypothetical protein
MRRFGFRFLPALGFLVLCIGCSSVNPHKPPVADVPTPIQEPANTTHTNYFFPNFVNGWLNGKSPPPDFNQNNENASPAWRSFGELQQSLGQILVGIKW